VELQGGGGKGFYLYECEDMLFVVDSCSAMIPGMEPTIAIPEEASPLKHLCDVM
jgi:hypothetical protein